MPRLYITLALMLSGMGMAVTNIQMALGHMGVKVHVDTITRILEHYFEVVQKYPETIKPPCVGDKWGCDEKHQKVRGREWYVTAIVDSLYCIHKTTLSSTKTRHYKFDDIAWLHLHTL